MIDRPCFPAHTWNAAVILVDPVLMRLPALSGCPRVVSGKKWGQDEALVRSRHCGCFAVISESDSKGLDLRTHVI